MEHVDDNISPLNHSSSVPYAFAAQQAWKRRLACFPSCRHFVQPFYRTRSASDLASELCRLNFNRTRGRLGGCRYSEMRKKEEGMCLLFPCRRCLLARGPRLDTFAKKISLSTDVLLGALVHSRVLSSDAIRILKRCETTHELERVLVSWEKPNALLLPCP